MILTTTETIIGKELETLGIVKGSTIQTVNAIRDIGAGLKTLVGGELTKYNDMMNTARALATKRMVVEAESMGADARNVYIRNESPYAIDPAGMPEYVEALLTEESLEELLLRLDGGKTDGV